MPETNKLNAKLCESIKEAGKYPDGGGLYLFVSKAGGKTWRYDYRFSGKRFTLTIGKYPIISLREAREQLTLAKHSLAKGVNPCEEKKAKKQEQILQEESQQRTFAVVAMDWFKSQQAGNAERTKKSILLRMNRHIISKIGSIPFSDVTFEKLRDLIRDLEKQGYADEHKRVAQILSQICRYARMNKWSETNIAEDLLVVLKKKNPNEKRNWPAITDKEGVAKMLRNIYSFVKLDNSTSIYMRAALKLYPLTAQRAQELLLSTWSEIDFDKRLWRIPPEHMKRRREHIIPLSNQAYNILKNLFEYRANGELIFHSGGRTGHFTSDGVNKAMHQAGIPKEEMTLHGWRAVFSTLCHNEGVPHEIVEVSLAHRVGNAVANAYNRADYLERRRKLMQWWADYLDCLREGKETPNYH